MIRTRWHLSTRTIATLALIAAPPCAFAHGPTPQKAEESIDIAAPLDSVWAKVKAFSRIADWNPALASSEGGDAVGERRSLRFPNGESVVEGLDEADDTTHTLRYRMLQENPRALAVSSHFTHIKLEVTPEGRTRVQWTSRFYRADTGNEPAEDRNDEAALQAMRDFMRQGLQGLRAALEGS